MRSLYTVAVAALLAVCASGCAYDLARDRSLRVSTAMSELGRSTRVVIIGDVYVFIDGGMGEDFDAAVSLAARAIGALLHDRFTAKPTRAVSVYLFAGDEDYEAYCKRRWSRPCPTPFGFYDVHARVAVIDAAQGAGTLVHELVHPLVEADFPGAPLWLDEGLAALYETPLFTRDDEIHGASNSRNTRLVAALLDPTEHDEVRVSRILSLVDADFRNGNEKLHYALARVFLQWLDHRGVLWPFYRRLRAGAGAQEAFVASTGLSVAEAQPLFETFIGASL